MDVASLSSLNTEPVQPAAVKSLGKDDFMNLLLKQLSYQDPLNPMDSTQFTSQMTQFSSLEKLENINGTLEEVLAFQHSMQNASVANFIGKDVRITGNSTYLKDTADISYELNQDAASVELSILGPQGGIVWSKDIGPQDAGEYTYVWDGNDINGNPLPEGTYTFKVDALDSSDKTVGATSIATGSVTGVVFKDGATFLELDDGRRVHISEIQSIQERRI